MVMFAILSDRNKYLTLCSVPIAVKNWNSQRHFLKEIFPTLSL